MHRKIALITLLVIMGTLLTSCYDANEIDDMTYVLSIGFDHGATDKLRLTLEFPTMQGPTGSTGSTGGGGSSSSDKSGYDTITMDVPGFFTGLNMINSTMPRKLNFMHVKFIVFSEEMAKSGDMGEYLAPLVRWRQIRRTSHVIVSKGTAKGFLAANKPFVGATLSKTMELMMNESDNTGLFAHETLNDLYDGIKSSYRQAVTILGAVNDFKNLKEDGMDRQIGFKNGGEYYAGQLPRQGGNGIELLGSAIFNGDTMVGEIDGTENRLMLMARGDFTRGFFTVQDPKNKRYIVPLDVRQEKAPNITVDVDGGKPKVQIRLHLYGDILAIQSRNDYESPGQMTILENVFEEEIKYEMEKLVEKCRNMKTDIFGFGEIAVRKFGTIQEWESYNWLKQFENAEVSTEVEFEIRRTGTLLKDSPIKSTEGNE